MHLNDSTNLSNFPSNPKSIYTSNNCPLPTPTNAYSGHSENQSIVEQLTKLGNILNLVANASPKGLIQIVI